MQNPNDDDLLIDLQSKFSHQEFIIEELRNAVLDQNKIIRALEKSMQVLKDRLDTLSVGKSEGVPVNEKPPHF